MNNSDKLGITQREKFIESMTSYQFIEWCKRSETNSSSDECRDILGKKLVEEDIEKKNKLHLKSMAIKQGDEYFKMLLRKVDYLKEEIEKCQENYINSIKTDKEKNQCDYLRYVVSYISQFNYQPDLAMKICSKIVSAYNLNL